MGRPIIDKTGERKLNNFGSEIVIVKYVNDRNADIFFPQYNYLIKNTPYDRFRNGTVRCPYEPRVHGVGYLGEGQYKASINRRNTKIYEMWENMLKRCYAINRGKRSVTYYDCSVNEEWHNFQNFAQWYEDNYYEIEGQKMCLDKDIKYKGNRVYSAKNCLIVPERINILFKTNRSQRGSEPIGVHYHRGEYVARCNTLNGRIQIGTYSNPKTAFQSYKKFKEKYIKQVADEYKHLIPKELYDAMYRYEIEITD